MGRLASARLQSSHPADNPQIGTVAFCALVGATMASHGGEHMWDVTAEEVKEANYVGNLLARSGIDWLANAKGSILRLLQSSTESRSV